AHPVGELEEPREPFLRGVARHAGQMRVRVPNHLARLKGKLKARSRQFPKSKPIEESGGKHAHTPDASRDSRTTGGREAFGLRVTLAPLWGQRKRQGVVLSPRKDYATGRVPPAGAGWSRATAAGP